ncbi:hypothetical protein PG988_012162 [Apiospora saccharicola]
MRESVVAIFRGNCIVLDYPLTIVINAAILVSAAVRGRWLLGRGGGRVSPRFRFLLLTSGRLAYVAVEDQGEDAVFPDRPGVAVPPARDDGPRGQEGGDDGEKEGQQQPILVHRDTDRRLPRQPLHLAWSQGPYRVWRGVLLGDVSPAAVVYPWVVLLDAGLD